MAPDIINIDKLIKHDFDLKYGKLNNYNMILTDLKLTLNNPELSYLSINKICSRIDELNDIIDTIKSRREYYFYILETSDILFKYNNILSKPIKENFIGKKTRDSKEKIHLIKKFLSISKNYSFIKSDYKLKEKRVTCNNCDNKKLFDIVDKCVYICTCCGAQQEILLHTSSYNDIDRINISAKYTYDRKIHFRDCINQYQGKQNSTIDSYIYDNLDKQFNFHNLLNKSKNITKHKKYIRITKKHIYLFLKELGYNKHYENVNLIHYNITGKPPDDIGYLEDRLMNDFDSLTELYDLKFKNKPGFERKNFINTQYVLYQLLVKYKHKCNKEDFSILKTVERKSFHDDISKTLFESLGWNHKPLS